MTPERFVEVFRLAALQAGQVARYLQGQVQKQEKAGETTPESAALTAVDLAAQDVILHQLWAAAPELRVDAEEDTELVSRFADAASDAPLVVIDPVDGTLNYTLGSQDYAVMGALLVRGFYEAAVVAFPAYGELYAAIRGAGAWVERSGGVRERLVAPPPNQRVLVSPRVPEPAQARLRQVYSEVSLSRCSAVDSSIVGLGRARAAVSEGRSDRRRAIGYLISLECGGVIWHADHPWAGEDPETLPNTWTPSITAESEATARRVLDLVRGA
jgi:fructose-1,6-bisphosphatase/inositol monophosphatase family enzyme